MVGSNRVEHRGGTVVEVWWSVDMSAGPPARVATSLVIVDRVRTVCGFNTSADYTEMLLSLSRTTSI